jgi:hypothetical protein
MAVISRPRTHDDALAEAIGLESEQLAMRKRFLEFGEDDVRGLEGMYDLTEEHVDSVIDAFYDHLLRFPQTRPSYATRGCSSTSALGRRSTSSVSPRATTALSTSRTA